MIEVVIPCTVKNSNKIKLLTLGFVDLPWSPNWTEILNTNNKVLVYDLVSDVTLDDSNILINVGHTSIKLNDFKFLFKVNGFHSNVKLYYDQAIVTDLIKHSIPLNMFMTIYEDLNRLNLLDSLTTSVDNIDLSNYINSLISESQGMLKFTRRFVDLIKNDNRIDVVEDLSESDHAIIVSHNKLVNYIRNQKNNTKEASNLVLDKLVDLLQLNKEIYKSLKGKAIPAGPASFNPILPNVTRAQLFRISGETEEQHVDGYSSGILFFDCKCPITLSFLIYQEDEKMQIIKNHLMFRPKLVGSKDPNLYRDITHDNNAFSDLRNKFNEEKLFDELDLNLDLLNKACKSLMNNDMIYYFAITKCYIDIDVASYSNSKNITEVKFDKTIQEALSTYDLIGLSLGGYRDE